MILTRRPSGRPRTRTAVLLTVLALATGMLTLPAHAGEWAPEKLERWHSLHTKQHADQWPEQNIRRETREAAKATR